MAGMVTGLIAVSGFTLVLLSILKTNTDALYDETSENYKQSS